MIKTRKIQIIPVGNKKEITQTLKNWSELSCQVANEVVRQTVFNLIRFDDFRKENPELNSEMANKMYKENYGFTVRGFSYDATKKYNLPSIVRGGISNPIYKTITKEKTNIFKNKVSIPSFTKDKMPIYFESGHTSVEKKDSNYFFKLMKDVVFKLNFGRDRSNNQSIIDKILIGEYKFCDSSITLDKNKIFLNISFKFESQKIVVENSDLVLGIDLGINRPITMARSDGQFVRQIDLGNRMLETRFQFQNRRKSLSKGLRFAKGGHGRNEKMKKLDNIRNKEHNFIQTMNHQITKSVIDYCKEQKISKIKMEDLTGITKDANKYFLKSWAYFQIQTMIKYKADECGIVVEYVDPKNTSKKCHCCGEIHEDSRDKIDVSKYTCLNLKCDLFGKTQDADINAAKNISSSEGFTEKPKSKKGRIETWKKKQINTEESLTELV
jgi:IS605 OrfB family transposase